MDGRAARQVIFLSMLVGVSSGRSLPRFLADRTGLGDPASQQVRVEPMVQGDGSDRHARPLALGDDLRLERRAVSASAPPAISKIRFWSVHVST